MTPREIVEKWVKPDYETQFDYIQAVEEITKSIEKYGQEQINQGQSLPNPIEVNKIVSDLIARVDVSDSFEAGVECGARLMITHLKKIEI